MATLFPNASKPKILPLVLRAGVDIVRLNCSYFEKDAYEDILSRVRTFQERDDVQIMIDLQGIKFRISSIDKYRCHRNSKDVRFLRLSQGDCMEFGIARDENDLCRSGRLTVPSTHATVALFKRLRKHSRLDFADGRHTFRIVRKRSQSECIIRVLNTNGILNGHAGISPRDLDLSSLDCDCMTEKDIADAKWALQYDVDWINLSFVRSEKDVMELVRLMDILNIRNRPKICVKIETAESLRRFDRILEVCDGIMVARGDLGLAIGLSRIPYAQKLLVRKSRDARKFVIVATGMLESMYGCESGVPPTRADISDIQNAIFDGCNAVMLSGETAGGSRPVECIQVMASAARQADSIKSRLAAREVVDGDDDISTKISDSSPSLTKPNVLVLFGPPGNVNINH